MIYFKFLLSFFLIPFVISFSTQFIKVFNLFIKNPTKEFSYFFSGFIVYIALRLLFSLKKSKSFFVFIEYFTHELCHAIFTWLMLGRVEHFITAIGGGSQVRTNRPNFIVKLSPYFFPLWSILFLGLIYIIQKEYVNYLITVVGFFYGLHFFMFLTQFRFGQKDIYFNGILFSTIFIIIMKLFFISFLIYSIHFKLEDLFGDISNIIFQPYKDFLKTILSLKK